MAVSKKAKPIKKRVSKKKQRAQLPVLRLLTLLAIFLLLGITVSVAGYVIFFRTVFAQEILPTIRNEIVFEEPDPPSSTDPIDPQIIHPIAVKHLPKVAIIFDDLGYSWDLGEQLINFPFELTYSFLPFAPYTEKLENDAYNAGKTIFLHLPLEPKGQFWDPGPGVLYLDDEPGVYLGKFKDCLLHVPHAVGVNNHMGSRFTESRFAMRIVLQEVKKQSLVFVDSFTTAGSVGLEVAQEEEIHSARRHVFLDNELDNEKICDQLKSLVEIAEKNGRGIGIAHPHGVTVSAIRECGELYLDRVEYVSVLEVLY